MKSESRFHKRVSSPYISPLMLITLNYSCWDQDTTTLPVMKPRKSLAKTALKQLNVNGRIVLFKHKQERRTAGHELVSLGNGQYRLDVRT